VERGMSALLAVTYFADALMKIMLQQLVEKDGASELIYEGISEEGPEHNKRFTVVALINNNEVGRGKAKNKKDAEMQAAKVALKLFGIV
jgi:ribonuclease-3